MSSYQTLEHFLADNKPDIDTMMDDGGGVYFRVKGKQIEAAVLFIDMGRFSKRTRGIPPAATLILVNRFFNWITAQGLKDRAGIIDKYIGDEVMLVFAKEFGSTNPYVDAVKCAVGMSEYDPWGFSPHAGIAYGKVIVGLVETIHSNAYSVFGDPVTIAARLAGFKDARERSNPTVVFASHHWDNSWTKELLSANPDIWTVEESIADESNTKGLPATRVYLLSKDTNTFLMTELLEPITPEEIAVHDLQKVVDKGEVPSSLISD